MKARLHRTLRVLLLLLLMTLSPAGVRAFGVNDVLKLHQSQLSDSLIVLQIERSGDVIHVSSSDFRRLKQAGVSDEVMSAMLRSEKFGFQKNADGHYGVAPHAYLPYAYGPPGYPRSSLAFSFSYGYGGYRWPYYRPAFGFRYSRYPFRRW